MHEIVKPIPNPTTVLGDWYNTPLPYSKVTPTEELKWLHADDQFVEFQVVTNVVMGDTEFFARYVSNKLKKEGLEKGIPYHFHPCFADRELVVNTHLANPMLAIEESHHCFMVVYRNTFGLLIIGEGESMNILRRGIGFEYDRDDVTDPNVVMQYMRFDDDAVELLDLSYRPWEQYIHNSKREPLRVNFAPYTPIPLPTNPVPETLQIPKES